MNVSWGYIKTETYLQFVNFHTLLLGRRRPSRTGWRRRSVPGEGQQVKAAVADEPKVGRTGYG
jgi:hypothetical protein